MPAFYIAFFLLLINSHWIYFLELQMSGRISLFPVDRSHSLTKFLFQEFPSAAYLFYNARDSETNLGSIAVKLLSVSSSSLVVLFSPKISICLHQSLMTLFSENKQKPQVILDWSSKSYHQMSIRWYIYRPVSMRQENGSIV